VGFRRLVQTRNARVFLTGQAVSSFGDSALWLATGIWVKALTGSSGAAGLTFFFFFAPSLLAPVTGLLVDRLPRRTMLVAVNVLTGCAVLLLLLVDSKHQLWLIYAVMVIYGLSFSTLAAAQSALLTTILPEDLLADANGALRTIQGTLSLVAPMTGAGLYALVGPRPLIVLDAASFAVPVICALMLRLPKPQTKPHTTTWRAQLGAGIKHLAGNPTLRDVTFAAVFAVLGFGFSETTVFAVAGNGLHEPPAFVGVLVALQGLGAVLAGPTAAPMVRRIGECPLIALGLMLTAAGALLEIAPTPIGVLPGVVLFGFSLPWVLVGLTTLLQRLTPRELQGRVYAAADAVITAPQTLSIALGAGLIGIVGYRALLATMAASNAVAGAYLVRRYRWRVREQPDQSRQRQRAGSAGVGRLLRRAAGGRADPHAQLRAAGAVAGARAHAVASVRARPAADQPPSLRDHGR
jgi:MFS family permease